MDTNYEFLEEVEVEVEVDTNDIQTPSFQTEDNLTELVDVNVSPRGLPERKENTMILDRHLRFYPMSLVTYNMEPETVAKGTVAKGTDKARSRPMTRGYARELYKEAHPEPSESSDSDSDSEYYSDSDNEIVFSKPYKRGEHEQIIFEYIIKPPIIIICCLIWWAIAFGNLKSSEITRPSPYQMNAPNQMCNIPQRQSKEFM